MHSLTALAKKSFSFHETIFHRHPDVHQCLSSARSTGINFRLGSLTFSSTPPAMVHAIGKFPGNINAERNGRGVVCASSWMGSVLPAVPSSVSLATSGLKGEEVIAVPSDTLYGLAGDACSAAAIQRIYEMKGRNPAKPIAICVADVADLQRFAATDHLPTGLLENLYPGPVTLVLPRAPSSRLSPALNPGSVSIGVRIPDASFLLSVARDFGGAIALTSANPSSHPSCITVEEFKSLWEKCAAIFDGGRLGGGREGSTVIDLTKRGEYRVLRGGSSLQPTTKILNEMGLQEVPSNT